MGDSVSLLLGWVLDVWKEGFFILYDIENFKFFRYIVEEGIKYFREVYMLGGM